MAVLIVSIWLVASLCLMAVCSALFTWLSKQETNT